MREQKRRSVVKVVHPYAWLWEPLQDEPSFVLRAMFGTRTAYVGGKLMLCFAAKSEPWRGVLVCMEREHHASLLQAFPDLSPHPILPKWLYLPEAAAGFERTASALVQRVRRGDPRIGVIPQPRRTAQRSMPRPR